MNKLKEKRVALGYTQKQVADMVGVVDRAYQRYEQTERLPNVKTAIKIAKALQTTVEELYGD